MDTMSHPEKRFLDQCLNLVLQISTLVCTMRPQGKQSGLVVEPRTPERKVGGSIPTSAVLCP